MTSMDQLDEGRIEFGRDPTTDVEVLSRDEVYEKMRRHEPVQLVNVSDPKFYHLGSIKTSLRIPLGEIESRLMELDKSKEIITYCESYDCQEAKLAARLLRDRGFFVQAYGGGIDDWKTAGFAIDLH